MIGFFTVLRDAPYKKPRAESRRRKELFCERKLLWNIDWSRGLAGVWRSRFVVNADFPYFSLFAAQRLCASPFLRLISPLA